MNAVRNDLKTRDVAEHFGVDPKTITKHARRLGLGVNFGGRAGKRFNESDIEALRTALTDPALEDIA